MSPLADFQGRPVGGVHVSDLKPFVAKSSNWGDGEAVSEPQANRDTAEGPRHWYNQVKRT